ncbi:protein kinase domain protein [Stylonychia lemnae]|uniref:PIH1 domain-containing protein 1 n=1 Tax=Stylonychia lemnae TaxID=5949 RepID=A0A077ZTU0_STYLE|nr:protein kinase domain protein [Stylonychia lemnae]|eukprot:CDW72984.1 protein kinase domain protein [Stylonychia lemnae]
MPTAGAPDLAGYSHEDIMKLYQQLMSGQVPPDLQNQFESFVDANGNPIIDAEGGAMIQPQPGFVVKTKDKNGQKVFINMTTHDLVDPFEEKPIPEGDREKFGDSESGIRIPLSMGQLREDFDKKGEAAQVCDVIWNPKTIERCKIDAQFRQIVVELAFNYYAQKFNVELDLRFTLPKMKYKGKTIQYQRVRAKKAPKIQEMEMSEEERKNLEAKGLEQVKNKVQEVVEKTPEWQLYCILKQENEQKQEYLERFDQEDFWNNMVNELVRKSDESGVGDSQDRFNTLAQTFRLPEEVDLVEEFDGTNHELAQKLVFVISLPILKHAKVLQVRVSNEVVAIRVPHLYKLELGLPIQVDNQSARSYFEGKLRKLFVILSLKPTLSQQDQSESLPSKIEIVDTKKLENDLLFDVI